MQLVKLDIFECFSVACVIVDGERVSLLCPYFIIGEPERRNRSDAADGGQSEPQIEGTHREEGGLPSKKLGVLYFNVKNKKFCLLTKVLI